MGTLTQFHEAHAFAGPQAAVGGAEGATKEATKADFAEYFLIVNAVPAVAGQVEVDGSLQPGGVPLGPFAADTIVQLTALGDSGYDFAGWDGPVGNSAAAATTLVMSGANDTIEVTAHFVPISYTLTIIEDPDEGGDVVAEPLQVQYFPEETVTLTAIPMDNYNFVQWVIDEVDVLTQNPLTLSFVDFSFRDITVRAVFTQRPVLTILETEGGTVDVSPPGLSENVIGGDRLVEYAAGTAVTLTAAPDDYFEFVQWEGDIPESDRFSPETTFTIEADKTVRAVFTTVNLSISDITPDSAWFFGGVVAQIRGTGFMPGSTQLRVFGAPVAPLLLTSTEIWFMVPPLPVPPASQTLTVDVRVSNPPYTESFSQSITFTYRRYQTAGNVTTTAFQYTGETMDIPVALGVSLADASLMLPPPQQPIDFAYGLIRATKQASLFEADAISAGSPIADAWCFDIHLYNPQVIDVGLNTGAATLPEITDWTYQRDEATVPAQLEFTVADTGLTAAAIRNDLMMWSIDTRYDYGGNITTVVSPVNTGYQSTIEQLEVTPNVTPELPAATTPVTSVVIRLYDLSAFALRTDISSLPAEFLAGMAINAPATVSGPTSGGTQFTINAPLGGLAWVTVGFAENVTAATPVSATQLGAVIDNGATEFSAVVQAPEWPGDQDTTVDVAIYLNSNLNGPLIVFEDAFRYLAMQTPAAKPVFSPPPGDYTGPIGISCATDGAEIHYTLDGAEPTETSPVYNEPISLSATTTIAAKAFADGLAPSETAFAHYVYSELPLASFSAAPLSGTAPLAVTFTDTSSPGASPITAWHWNLGDSETTLFSPQPVFAHTYITPGVYTVTLELTNSAGSDVMTRTSLIRVYGSAGGADSDGDGLSDAVETNTWHTDPYDADTDADGMDDGWEVLYELDPLADDACGDVDGDGWTNLDEYQRGSNPLDPLSPNSVYYVATDGDDIIGDGSSSSPWRTVAHATELLEGTEQHPVLVRVYPGVYEEGELILSPWLTVAGIEMAAQEVVQITGAVFAAEGAGLKDLTVLESSPPEPAQQAPLLTLHAPMVVQNVAFVGADGSLATAIVASGAGQASLVEGCIFESLQTGIEILGGAPVIRRCTFFNISGSAIRVSDVEPKEGNVVISSADNPNSGYNTFLLATIGADAAVVNERDQQLIMENNDWDTDEEAEIAARVSGDTDFIPYLGKGAGAAAASVHCRVWDADSQQPVVTGSVQLGPGTFTPITKNTAGVYSFACLSPGTYTFTFTAPGYLPLSLSKSVGAGTSDMLLFTLVKATGDTGDDGGGGCFSGKIDQLPNTPTRESQANATSSGVMLAAMIVLLAAALLRKRTSSATPDGAVDK